MCHKCHWSMCTLTAHATEWRLKIGMRHDGVQTRAHAMSLSVCTWRTSPLTESECAKCDCASARVATRARKMSWSSSVSAAAVRASASQQSQSRLRANASGGDTMYAGREGSADLRLNRSDGTFEDLRPIQPWRNRRNTSALCEPRGQQLWSFALVLVECGNCSLAPVIRLLRPVYFRFAHETESSAIRRLRTAPSFRYSGRLSPGRAELHTKTLYHSSRRRAF